MCRATEFAGGNFHAGGDGLLRDEKFRKQTAAQDAEGERQEPTPAGVTSQRRVKVSFGNGIPPKSINTQNTLDARWWYRNELVSN